MRNIKIVKCLICDKDYPSVGLDSHLKYTHKISTVDYKLKYIVKEYNDLYTCLICDSKNNISNFNINNKVKLECILNYRK